jgi:citrate lyase beta subunit
MSLVDEAQSQLERLGAANRAFAESYPGERPARQPVHTVYGGAQLFTADTARRMGELALKSMGMYGRDPVELARGVGFDASLAAAVHARVLAKLEREPVEDYRIDFEDGLGARPDAEEDAAARATAREVARGMADRLLPPFIGIRIKAFAEEWKLRAARTLEIFVDTLLGETGGRLPEGFVVTLPKVTHAEQPATLVRLLSLLEDRHGLAPGTLRMEIMIEVTQALLGRDGRSPLPGFLAACAGRCVGAHLGTYDYTASCNITAAHQRMDHPMCDLARGMMQLAYAGTGIFLSDGATNVMPVGPHKGKELTVQQTEENRSAVHAAWQLSHRHIRRSLEFGFYQGWDLHPAQLPVRFGACFAFFLEGFAKAAERLRNFVEQSAQATLVGEVFDDAATGQGLLNYFLRALASGAITLEDVAATGMTPEEMALRSFAKILKARRERA